MPRQVDEVSETASDGLDECPPDEGEATADEPHAVASGSANGAATAAAGDAGVVGGE